MTLHRPRRSTWVLMGLFVAVYTLYGFVRPPTVATTPAGQQQQVQPEPSRTHTTPTPSKTTEPTPSSTSPSATGSGSSPSTEPTRDPRAGRTHADVGPDRHGDDQRSDARADRVRLAHLRGAGDVPAGPLLVAGGVPRVVPGGRADRRRPLLTRRTGGRCARAPERVDRLQRPRGAPRWLDEGAG